MRKVLVATCCLKAFKHLVQGNELREGFPVVVSGDYREVALSVHFVLNLQFGWLPAEIYPHRQSCKSYKLGKNILKVGLLWISVSRKCPFHFRLMTNISSCLGRVQKKRLIVWRSFAIQEHLPISKSQTPFRTNLVPSLPIW